MCLVFRVSIFGLVVVKGKVVDTIPVPILVGMYCIDTYTSIEMPTFRTGLNIGHVPTILVNFKFYWLVPSGWYSFFFFFLLVLSFLNFYKGKMVIYFALTY